LHIRLEEVSKQYGKVLALDNVTLDVSPGQIIAVIGANGAGKTTLLRCLDSLVSPTKGQILFDGEPLRRDHVGMLRRLMFLPDFPIAYAHMSPLRHIAMVLRLYDKDRTKIQQQATDVLAGLDLLALIDTPLQRLSRGQIYKTALAAMILVDPELWLLDEPIASGMDPAGIMYFKQACRVATSRGRTLIYSTQLLEIAENFSDHVCLLHRGAVKIFEDVKETRKRTATSDGALEEIFRQLRETKS
jgi:ABC-2 type transport system ATP-binding protein